MSSLPAQVTDPNWFEKIDPDFRAQVDGAGPEPRAPVEVKAEAERRPKLDARKSSSRNVRGERKGAPEGQRLSFRPGLFSEGAGPRSKGPLPPTPPPRGSRFTRQSAPIPTGPIFDAHDYRRGAGLFNGRRHAGLAVTVINCVPNKGLVGGPGSSVPGS